MRTMHTCVCVYISMYICMYACGGACMYMCMCVPMGVRYMYACACVRVHARVCAHGINNFRGLKLLRKTLTSC